jgi:hypothetical protein
VPALIAVPALILAAAWAVGSSSVPDARLHHPLDVDQHQQQRQVRNSMGAQHRDRFCFLPAAATAVLDSIVVVTESLCYTSH